ncbi:hypothetical protein [Enterobacter pseudoroggenkampii]|uniref:hypothetical protein n=1 Tax=Enterobacter pseudoroggenkampii TaxID=2996112 RepID=UPI0038AECBC2
MSVKTEAIKPAAEISLFDAFGPNVSEQVQAINQRAAELSMDDMALVMGVTTTAKKKPEIAAASEDPDDAHELLLRWLEFNEQKSGVSFRTTSPLVKGYTTPPPDFCQRMPVAAGLVRPYIPVLRIGQQGIHEVIGAVSSKLHHLQSVGADESTFKVSIRYKDPKTGAFRHETLEADSATNPSPFHRTKLPTTKRSRRGGRELVMHTLTAKK